MNHSGTTTLNHLWDADHKNTRKISRKYTNFCHFYEVSFNRKAVRFH